MSTSYKKKYNELYLHYIFLLKQQEKITKSRSWFVIKKYYHLKTIILIKSYNCRRYCLKIYHFIKKKIYNTHHRRQLDFILQKHKNKPIIILPPSIDWNIPQFQRPQYIAKSLSKLDCVFFYCTSNQYDNVDGFSKVNQNLYLTNRFDLIKIQLHTGWIILHASHPSFTLKDIKDFKKQGFKIIYDYMDKIDPLISGNNQLISKRHSQINKNYIDLGLATAKNLYEELSTKIGYLKTIYNPNGVDYEHFHVIKNSLPTPLDLLPVVSENKPIVGYIGAMAKWLNYDLINYIAKNNPQLNFVFIGWDYDHSIAKLKKYKNIFYLGVKNYQDVPAYSSHFNVAIIPFSNGGIAKSTSPLKLFEYFALGKQVVITKDLEECKKFGGVYSSETFEDFSNNLKLALKNQTNIDIMYQLDQQALANTWPNRANTIYEYIKSH